MVVYRGPGSWLGAPRPARTSMPREPPACSSAADFVDPEGMLSDATLSSAEAAGRCPTKVAEERRERSVRHPRTRALVRSPVSLSPSPCSRPSGHVLGLGYRCSAAHGRLGRGAGSVCVGIPNRRLHDDNPPAWPTTVTTYCPRRGERSNGVGVTTSDRGCLSGGVRSRPGGCCRGRRLTRRSASSSCSIVSPRPNGRSSCSPTSSASRSPRCQQRWARPRRTAVRSPPALGGRSATNVFPARPRSVQETLVALLFASPPARSTDGRCSTRTSRLSANGAGRHAARRTWWPGPVRDDVEHRRLGAQRHEGRGTRWRRPTSPHHGNGAAAFRSTSRPGRTCSPATSATARSWRSARCSTRTSSTPTSTSQPRSAERQCRTLAADGSAAQARSKLEEIDRARPRHGDDAATPNLPARDQRAEHARCGLQLSTELVDRRRRRLEVAAEARVAGGHDVAGPGEVGRADSGGEVDGPAGSRRRHVRPDGGRQDRRSPRRRRAARCGQDRSPPPPRRARGPSRCSRIARATGRRRG